MRMRSFILLCSCFILFISHKPVLKKNFSIKTVVIDAGHGGHDYGCLGATAKEKNIALDVSLKLGELIEKKFPDVKVIYTRKTDVFIELHERAGIANRAKADLFICIHCNSACVREPGSRKETCNESVHGPETYVMGLHKTEDNLAVSRRENSSVLYEKDYKTKYDGFDPNSPEANIIFTLFQNAFMSQSISFASKIQSEFEEYSGRTNRGVKQAGFLVLYRTTMPSVLIETGFLTNKNEEKYLLSDKGQNDVANSVFKAFKGYKVDLENDSSPDVTEKPQSPKNSETTANTTKESVKNLTKEIVPKQNLSDTLKTVDKPNKKDTSIVKTDTVPKTSIDSAAPAPIKIVPKNETKLNNKPTAKPDLVYYTVQIGAAQTGIIKGTERYTKVEELKKIIGEDGMTRFTVGSFQNINDAINMQGVMRGKGFKDAFVTAYHNNKRVTLKEADGLLKKN